MDEEQKTPKVFISYSHDSPEHKRWVTELASMLVRNGVDVILDQWDLSLGDDVPKFMEKSVKDADRVLMICTEPYVHKADDGKGGVGYEAMIVTGELVRDLGTSKFIPVIRQKSEPTLLPKSVSTRFYVNLSEGRNFGEEFDILLRELHQAPAVEKPSIGKKPFAVSPSGQELPEETLDKESAVSELKVEGKDISEIYNAALDIARKGDFVAWRRLIREARQVVGPALLQWREKYENDVPTSEEELVRRTIEGAATYSPLISIALAGVESGRSKFNNQLSVLDEILFPRDWNRGGYRVIVELPGAIAFFYQALHGAMCLQSDQLSLAIRMIRAPMEFPGWNENIPMWKHYEAMGCPESLGDKAKVAWNALISLPESWSWLDEVFGHTDEYRASICAYYMALNIQEYADLLALNNEESLTKGQIRLEIPLCFLSLTDDTKRRAYRLLTNDIDQVTDIWKSIGVQDSRVAQYWDAWINVCASLLNAEHRYRFHGRITHSRLIEEILPSIAKST